ncbi:MAG: cysteine--tRNA ligase [Deltaproteobacteria bacterium]|nr:cysteine--tRNA ligase [Deltaproteobacteria bacterium]
MAQPIQLYNTLTRQVSPFEPIQPGKVGMYVCGPTVYDRAHVGHARSMVVFDAFSRYLRHRGWQVDYVRNYTDVDDKIIARANERGEEPVALAERFIDAFRQDAEALGLAVPDHEPRVSENIPEILALVQSLVDQGKAYPGSDGTVWYSVASFPAYGKLSGQRVDELRGDLVEGDKRASADFALWKAAKPGEPSWDSPWGPGRPGWHIECSAMSIKHLGETFDIHGGGLDLVFPHHENEIAQSEGATGKAYARWWMHNGLLTMKSGEKMGKSLGNVFDIQDALALYPAEAMRLYYLQAHYRSPLPWGDEALPEALAMLARLYEAIEVAEQMGGDEPAAKVAQDLGKEALTVLELGDRVKDRIYESLDDDFNTSKALSHAFELARAINRFSNHKKAKKRGGPVVATAIAGLRLLGPTLGLLQGSPSDFQDEVKAKRLPSLGLTVEAVEQLLQERVDAREARDWSRADAIRQEIEAKGVLVMDRPDGVEWRIRLS